MSLLAKLYNRVLLNRLRPVLDPLLRKNQKEFRPGRGCPEHIFCFRRLIKGFKVKGGGGVIVFIDFPTVYHWHHGIVHWHNYHSPDIRWTH